MSSQQLYQRVLQQWWSCIAWNLIVFKWLESQLTSPVESETSSQLDTDLQLEVRSRTVLNQENEGEKLNKLFILNLTLMKEMLMIISLLLEGGYGNLMEIPFLSHFTSWKSLNECLNSLLLWQDNNFTVYCFVTRNSMKLFHSGTLLASSTSSK